MSRMSNTPLKGIMTCPVHNTSITAYRGRLGELHHYYLCVKSKECGQRHRIENVHQSIENILSKIQISAQVVMLYKSMLKKLFDKNDFIRLDEIERTQKEIEKVKERITNLHDDFMDNLRLVVTTTFLCQLQLTSNLSNNLTGLATYVTC